MTSLKLMNINKLLGPRVRVFFLMFIAVVISSLIYVILYMGNVNRSLKDLRYQTTNMFLHRITHNLTPGKIVFIGDSHVQGLATIEIIGDSVNLGIGTDTILGTLERLKSYDFKRFTKILVLGVGVNDLVNKTVKNSVADYKILLDALPKELNVLVSAVFIVDEMYISDKSLSNAKIESFNLELEKVVSTRLNTDFLNVNPHLIFNGQLENHIGDGLHLGEESYEIWISNLRNKLQ